MKHKKKVRKKAKRIVTLGLSAVVIIVVTCIALFSVFKEIVEKYQEKSELENQLVALQEKEVELENDVNKLKDPEYLARYAREKYFYSKDGEYILRLPEDDDEKNS